MNGKKMACVVLMMILAGIAYGAQIMQQHCKSMNAEAEAAETEAKSSETQRTVVETSLKRLEFDTQELRQFLKIWEPTVSRMQSAQDADAALQSMLRNSGILTVSQKIELRESREVKIIPKVLQCTVVVQDEYSKTLNWLGELERKMPYARVTVVRFKQGETGRQVNLELHLEIPIVDLDAKADEPKK
jgi:hypothetical protein